ncbi:iron chelate uptake ABC transporter family permease subunit [Pseudonocardia sp. DSM 110487]|uniref:FecCD family ABC transporter permease n=1 Tax=Pseudonocardia sp. DSM 110487 TaxID=2865833 RepID=UPI001C6A1CBF|nr:iron chelate uptake ABC transporter family permease subunit [Pseudonocardia sp. DSM 110487]QYN32248.1 iron chelate uptake ABC transporter family permease subunit [Pseudonocardia sp. DSM 110487]
MTATLRAGRVSLRVEPASVLLGAAAWAAALAVALYAVTVGDYPMPLSTVLDTLAGDGTLLTYDVVVRNRLPRALVGLLVGASLGMAGMVLQRIARNPLVSPDVIGVGAGASAGAVVMIVVVGAGAPAVAAGALTGAVAAAATVYAIAARGGFRGYQLVLVGIGVTALANAAASFLLTRSDRYAAKQAATWLVGDVAGRSWPDVLTVAAGLAVGAPMVLLLTRHLRLLELGDDIARALDGRIGTARAALVASAVGLTALATAAAGPIGFVALVAPQIVRRVLATQAAGLLPVAGVGALVVAAADLAARRLFSPDELPAGVLTAAVGAPVLLYLLVRVSRRNG